MIKSNTATFTAVKTVFRTADSFTPYASIPKIKKESKKWKTVNEIQLAESLSSLLHHNFNIKLQILPASNIISPAAKKSGYGAKPGESIGVCFPRFAAITLSIRSSKVPVQAFATLDVPDEAQKYILIYTGGYIYGVLMSTIKFNNQNPPTQDSLEWNLSKWKSTGLWHENTKSMPRLNLHLLFGQWNKL